MAPRILSAGTEDFSINTIIGAGSAVVGNLKINGFIRIDGDVDGNIETTSSVLIGENARIRGNISAASAVVGGIIIGDIKAPKSIKLLSSSVVIGDVITKNIQIDEDVIFNGHCISIKDEEEFDRVSQEFLEGREIRRNAVYQ